LKHLKNVLISLLFLTGIGIPSVWALPSAEDLLKTAYKKLNPDFDSQHAKYRTTTIIGRVGSTPVTTVITQEIWRKKPSLMKVTTNQDGIVKTVIYDGKYMYLQNDKGGYDPIRSSTSFDPFPQVPFDIKNFGGSIVQASGVDFLVILQGGQIGKVGIDRLEVLVDGKSRLIRWMKGFDGEGATLLDGSFTYDPADATTMKLMKMSIGSGDLKTDCTTETLINEKNPKLSEDLFSVVEP